MTLLMGSLQLGLIYSLLALGVFITFRILNVPDLTAEGSFTFGLAVSARLAMEGHAFLGIVAAVLAGALAGSLTGIFQTKLMIHPVLAGILTMSGLYSVNLLIMNSSSNLYTGKSTVFRILADSMPGLDKEMVKLLIPLVVLIAVIIMLAVFFRTQLGLCIRATGDNEDMVKASSINVHGVKILALALGNGCIAMSGAMIAQYQGFADINSGVGIIVVGLASVIIGELVCKKHTVLAGLISASIGSVIYRIIIAIALKYSPFPGYALKLVSACIVCIALSIPALQHVRELRNIKKGARRHVNHK